FLLRSTDLGRVFETGRIAEGALLEALPQQMPHATDFIGAGGTGLESDRREAQLPVGNEGCHIDGRRGLVQAIEIVGDRCPGNWIVAAVAVNDLLPKRGA